RVYGRQVVRGWDGGGAGKGAAQRVAALYGGQLHPLAPPLGSKKARFYIVEATERSLVSINAAEIRRHKDITDETLRIGGSVPAPPGNLNKSAPRYRVPSSTFIQPFRNTLNSGEEWAELMLAARLT